MSYDMIVGKGARSASAARLAGTPEGWLPSEARDYDSAYYQAFYKRVGASVLNARVFAALGAAHFTVQLHDDAGWRSRELTSESCPCALPACEHRDLLARAVADGLRLHRLLDREAFQVVPSIGHTELRATRRWPAEVGPRVVYVYAGQTRAVVRLHETGEHPIYVLEGGRCACGEPQPCVHRQLLELARAVTD